MTRTISKTMAGILEELELHQPTLITSEQLSQLLQEHGVKTPAKVVAARLRERGWLLPTDQRGVWEFVPAAVAGPYSKNDPVTPLRAFLAKRPEARCALTFQAAAWAHTIADRVPNRLEVAAESLTLKKQLPDTVVGTVFDPRLEYETLKSVPVLAKASIVAHMAHRPLDVRAWSSALDWFPEVAHQITHEEIWQEIAARPKATQVRTGYLLQGLRPDIAEFIHERVRITGKTWFGPRRQLLRHDSKWQVADTLLPFDPKTLGGSS